MGERKWADFELEEEGFDDADLLNVDQAGFETKPDEQGIKTVTCYTDGPNGTTIKVVKRVKVVRRKHRINKAVYDRKNIQPFGLEGPGSDPSNKAATIRHHEDIIIEVPKGRKKFGAGFDDQDQDDNSMGGLSLPKSSMDLRQKFKALRSEEGVDDDDLKASKTGGRVVRLNQYSKDMYSREGDQKRREENTIRVTNLSEDVKDDDLSDLFGKIGKIDRIYLAKHKEKKCSKGFAFITYHSHEDALKAIRQLNRHGYDNLLLNVEWARPSQREGGR